MLFRQMPRSRHVLVVAHAVREVLALVAAVFQIQFVVVDEARLDPSFLGEYHFVETDAIALGINV